MAMVITSVELSRELVALTSKCVKFTSLAEIFESSRTSAKSEESLGPLIVP